MRFVAGFVFGSAAIVAVHQPLLWLIARVTGHGWPAWSTVATRPFGVPAVVSAILFGGAWGSVLALLALRTVARRERVLARGAVYGAILPNAVGALLIVIRGAGLPDGMTPFAALAGAIIVNALWGALTVGGVYWFEHRR